MAPILLLTDTTFGTATLPWDGEAWRGGVGRGWEGLGPLLSPEKPGHFLTLAE